MSHKSRKGAPPPTPRTVAAMSKSFLNFFALICPTSIQTSLRSLGASAPSSLSLWVDFLGCGILGIVSGLLMANSNLLNPAVVAGTFTGSSYEYLQFILCATYATTISNTLLAYLLSDAEYQKLRMRDARSIVATVLGGMLGGAGISLCGTSGILVYTGIGSGLTSAMYTWLGGALGVIVYGTYHSSVFCKLESLGTPQKEVLVDRYFGMKTRRCLGMAACLETLIIVCAYKYIGIGGLVGFGHGAISFPMKYLLCHSLGTTRSWIAVVARIRTQFSNASVWFVNRSGIPGFWQWTYLMGTLISGFLLRSSDTLYWPIWKSFLGGYLLITGAILSAGCVTGHIVSGIGDLNIVSLVVPPSMFLGGWITSRFV